MNNDGPKVIRSEAIPLRILFAGGCHVAGFPIGAQFAFPRITLAHLAEEFSCEAKCIERLSLSNVQPLVAECQHFHPDIVVLQLGHYESGLWLKKRLRRLLARAKLNKAVPKPSAEAASISSVSLGKAWWQLQSLVRILGDHLLTFAGSPPYQLTAFECELDGFLRRVHMLSIRYVFLLSPFPCSDLAIRARRSVMRSFFARCSTRYNFQYLDVSNDLNPAELIEEPSLYIDAFHLGSEGHRRIGVKLAAVIGKHVKEMGRSATA
jgi:hypothetical protein